MKSGWCLAIVSLLTAIPAAAQTGPALLRVNPGPKRNFYADGSETQGCPALTAACRRRAFVVPGDQLVSYSHEGDFTYVAFVGRDGRPTRGWIETSALTIMTLPPFKSRDWLGSWQSWDASIRIAQTRGVGMFRVEGDATWGGHDPGRVAIGAVNLGDFGLDLRLNARHAAFTVGEGAIGAGPYSNIALPYDDLDDYRCKIDLQLLGPYLIADDNHQCGGVNVSFGGVYRR